MAPRLPPRLYQVQQKRGPRGEALLVGITVTGDVLRSVVYAPIAPAWWGKRVCRGVHRTEYIRRCLVDDPDFIRHL